MILRLASVALLVAMAAVPVQARTWYGGGPAGGWITDLLRPTGPTGFVYAATWFGGVFRSGDNGATWQDFTGDLDGVLVWDLAFAFDGTSSPAVFAATEDRGVFRAFAGQPWEAVNRGISTPDPVPARALQIHPHDIDVVTVATSNGIYTSNNGGTDWPDSLHWLPGFSFSDVEVSPLAPVTIYAMQSQDLYVSPDKGRRFDKLGVEQGLPPNALWVDVELFAASLDTIMVASTARGVYASVDAGENFAYIGPALESERNGIIRSMTTDDENGALILASEDGVFKTYDLGDTWETLISGLGVAAPQVYDVLVDDAADQTLLLGTFRHGVVRTGPGGHGWQEQNQGLNASLSRALHVQGDDVLVGTAHGGLYHSQDAANSWLDVRGNLDAIQIKDVHRFVSSGRWLVASSDGVWLSDDQGDTWRMPTIPPVETNANRFVAHDDLGDTGVFVGTIAGVYKSNDQGDVWSLVTGVPATQNYLALEYDLQTQQLWIGGLNDAFYVGPPQGPFERFVPPPGVSRAMFDFAFPGTGAIVASGSDLYHLIPEPGGYQVVSLGNGLPFGGFESGPAVKQVEYDALRDRLFVGLSERGVFEGSVVGGPWVAHDSGLRVPRIERLVYSEESQLLYAATFGGGVFALDASVGVAVLMGAFEARLRSSSNWVDLTFELFEMASVEILRSVDGGPFDRVWYGSAISAGSHTATDQPTGADRFVEYQLVARFDEEVGQGQEIRRGARVQVQGPAQLSFKLGPNWPNPFNPRTTIPVELVAASDVQLEVIDVRGRRVARLFRGVLEPGRHEFVWNGNDERDMPLPSGVYQIRLRAGQHVRTHSMTLLR